MIPTNMNQVVQQGTLAVSGGAGGWEMMPLLRIILILAAALVADFLTKRVLLTLIKKAAAHTRNTVDDALVDSGLFSRLAHMAPALVIYLCAPFALASWMEAIPAVRTAALVVILIVGAATISAALNALVKLTLVRPAYRSLPIRGIVQVIQLLLYLAVIISVFSLILGKSPAILLSSLGALTAVTMLVFKDAILGFVAGIQLSANQMLHEGDWLEMPAFGADGDVIEISLTTVKVQNWDKTITTIPTYALISNSFKNWRGMSESGGRRIKRTVYLDMTSIRFSNEEMIQKYRRMQLLKPYIDGKLEDIAKYNREQGIDDSELVNGRRITNVGTFRAYLGAYLKSHPMINQEMTFLVRHLQPTEKGLPIEIYVFSSDKVWANYEAIQADIFDHVLAIIPEFGLRIFQNPTGADFQNLTRD